MAIHPHSSVMQGLLAAGRVHARHRGVMFFLRSLKWLVLALALWMVADVLLHFGEPLRLTALIVLAMAGFGVVVASVAIMVFFRPPLLRIARLLESRHPELGSKLVNFLQLDDESRNPAAGELTRQLATRAVEGAAATIPVGELPQQAREPGLPRAFGLAVWAPLGLLVLTFSGGPHARNEWARLLDPYGDHPPFSLTRLTILDPREGHEVRYGESLVVQVRAMGHQPRELFLSATAADPGVPPVTLPMISRGDGTFIAALDHIRHPLELVAHTAGNGARSHRRRLGVILIPQIQAARVRLVPPAYTGQPARETGFRFAGLQALEGTEISFQIETNRPLGEGRVVLLTGKQPSPEVALKPDPAGKAEVGVAALTALESGKLEFHVMDVAGNAAATVPTSSLTVTRDQPPVVTLAVPEKDGFVVEGFTLPVTVEAGDDYGLRSVRTHLLVNGRAVPMDEVKMDSPDVRRHRAVNAVALDTHGIRAGDEITLFAEAVDTRPDPQISRTTTRRLGVITEAQYNDYLRRESDVAMIAGKYEDLQARFEQQVATQREIEARHRELAEKAGSDPEAAKQLAESVRRQQELNGDLARLADEMADFGRENPVYDFEKELQQKLREQAEAVKESIAKNERDNQAAGERPQPLADAATAHRERLEGGAKALDQEVMEPLEDLARLHELIKDFNRFQQLTDGQRELAAQSKAYETKPELSAEDKLALRELGAAQRAQARELDDLAHKLRHDAAQAKEDFPKAAGSAETLADAIEQQALPAMARSTAQKMLGGDGAASHPGAQQLFERMDALFCEACEQGREGAGSELDRALGLQRGMNPGNSFEQMMQSLNFRPGPDRGSGAGGAGMMANRMGDGAPQMLGGETLLDGPLSRAISGKGNQGGPGMAGGPTARIDDPDAGRRDHDFSRRTTTPASGTILSEYERIADAYFKSLTQPP